jgi:hypothetical protein
MSAVLLYRCTASVPQVANPRYRGYSIYISDSAVIARRDGILKFMFRIADVRRTQVRCVSFPFLSFVCAF